MKLPNHISFKDSFSKVKNTVTEHIGKWKELYSQRAKERMQSDEMLALSEKLRLHKNKVRIRTALITAAFLAVVISLGAYYYVRVFHRYKTVSSTERADDNATRYIQLKKGVMLKCNPNGVTCVNKKGEVQWNTTFSMQNLTTDVCGTTVAVADQRGNDVYIFNEKGLMGHFTVEHTLTKVKVAEQGVVAVILEESDNAWVNVYDSSGNLIVKNQTSMAETGYPVDMDLSSDGLKMVVSFLGISNNNVESRVIFYNFSSVGQDQNTNLVNQVNYEGQVVPEVRFMDRDYAVAFRDDGVTIFQGKRVPEEKNSLTVEEEIVSAFSSDDYFGIVTENADENHTEAYKMQVYRESGTKCFTAYFDLDYTDIEIYEDEIFIYNSGELMIYAASGKLKCDISMEKQIRDVLPASGWRKYTVITQDSTDIIRIK